MSDKKKYTMPEAAAILGMLGAIVPVMLMVIAVPIQAFQSWIRMTIWNWFHSYFGLPAIGFWPMFAMGFVIGSWRGSPRSLKDEYYKGSWSVYFFGQIGIDLLGLFLAYLLHVFVLR